MGAQDILRLEPSQSARSTEAASGETEVIMLGAGIAGSAAASALARQGRRVVLIAQHERHPPEFRAEKLGEPQMRLRDRMGLGEAGRAAATAFDGVWLHRFGRIAARSARREYGCDYGRLVDALRAALPPTVQLVVGRTDAIETGPSRQTVRLRDGQSLTARLLVVATGLGEEVRRVLGLRKEMVSPAHTLAAGFTLTRVPSEFPFPSLVWTGERFGDRVSYLTLFPVGDTMRANLYVYRTPSEAWVQDFRLSPNATLRALMPRLEETFGEVRVNGPVVLRAIDLYRVREHERDGFVVVGDAFATSCPITGTGIDKALTDVDRLRHFHLPRWFETLGMGAEKLASFYADPVKQARDRSALRVSLDARSIKVETSLRWRLKRAKSETLVRMLYRLPSNRFMERH
ncbi:FAD-dependent oxidoreductase [Methylobacterium gnaphalii]|uniref:Monooxygenase FAD-binding protein n=1 Tax=Methylobacterium gnaphalii TaxID=1010610 RepID=A0A512JPV0_9HYPH|nr:FAD-dependent monooxygenase [Methylobacterium gnaphalii]GEP11971.1 monooxygenase FAD-binding protein [Methylobacterium gnaphalii]GJD68680.1 tRNA 5-methylaminomethyl-2-thiouridine biosynthesis bifunctional protein MnmC [Methylobacterium gnaphalii]GLS49423.1 monooxygenase FAD-binding protein [Methylobacterium gnaphalii]